MSAAASVPFVAAPPVVANVNNSFSVRDSAAYWLFTSASLLFHPACKVRENYYMIKVVDALYPHSPAFLNSIRKVVLFMTMIGWGLLAIIPTLPSLILRALAVTIQRDNFLSQKDFSSPKALGENRHFTLRLWNICGPAAGYSITDGGVLPWPYRIDSIIADVISENADVNCFNEVFDFRCANYLREKLFDAGYKFIYYFIGQEKDRVNSGLFVASKFPITDPKFTPFSLASLVGRTKNAAKGYFAFTLLSQGIPFARVYSTHFQHSEIPNAPTNDDENGFEVNGRNEQMTTLLSDAEQSTVPCKIVTGDLNLDVTEFNKYWKKHFKPYPEGDRPTWLGDDFSARLMGKPISKPLKLDWTLIPINSAGTIVSTRLGETRYDPTLFTWISKTDHMSLTSTIEV